MAEKDIESVFIQQKSLISDDYYFKYIFKKTEKVVCAVFYVLQHIKDTHTDSGHVQETEKSAHAVLTSVHETLQLQRHAAHESCLQLNFAYLMLESKLRLLHASGLLTDEHLAVFVSEIESVFRSMRDYLQAQKHTQILSSENFLSGGASERVTPKSRPQTTRSSIASTNASPRENQTTTSATPTGSENRTARVLAVVRSQPEASIKDISDVIKDCSEKTIQRELNGLIKDGQIVREGQRRWSKYTAL